MERGEAFLEGVVIKGKGGGASAKGKQWKLKRDDARLALSGCEC